MPWDFAAELRRWGPVSVAGLCESGSHRLPASQRPASRPVSLQASRLYCACVAGSHYENFTVASGLLPRRLIRHFHAVYAYCRWSDDLADETGGGQHALDLIAWWRGELQSCYHGEPRHPVTIALRETIRRFDIPPDLFLNLLIAFEQDQCVKRYDTFAQLLDYCRNSANPVGRLVLHLFESFDAERAALSDEVCTGLQLANFWQDVARDYAIGRVYLPAEDCARFGYSEWGHFTPAFAELLRFQVERARGFFDRGSALLPLLPREARIDIDLFIRGGRAILDAVERIGFDVWAQRPEVSKWAKARLLAGAMWRRATV